MTNNSGKFEEVLSYSSADKELGPENNEGLGGDPGQGGNGSGDPGQPDGGIGGLIPQCPCSWNSEVEYYFGRLWWLWIVAIGVYLIKD